MGIETTFTFKHEPSIRGLVGRDLLGPLRGFVGNDRCRTWRGRGLNLIWRPNFGEESGKLKFFLQLQLTDEMLSFTDITGAGIINRGENQESIPLGGLLYLQTICDHYDHTGQHVEPGVWSNVPATKNPEEKPTVVRMGTIPHGTTFNLQGTDDTIGIGSKPQFDKASILPFKINKPDDGQTGLSYPPDDGQTGLSYVREGTKPLDISFDSRTHADKLPGLTDEQFKDPNLLLCQAIANQTFVRPTTVLKVTSDTRCLKSIPDVGGGTNNIAFLTGKGASCQYRANAEAVRVTATFWIERVIDEHGKEFDQLQYTQRVLLKFNNAIWPHITVGTLRVDDSVIREELLDTPDVAEQVGEIPRWNSQFAPIAF